MSNESKIAKIVTIISNVYGLEVIKGGGQMIRFPKENHINKKTKKTTEGEFFVSPERIKISPPKNNGANQDMALGVEHIYQLLKKAQENAATGCFLSSSSRDKGHRDFSKLEPLVLPRV